MRFHFVHHFNFLLNRELDELYISIALRSLAMSLVGIFIPIYLLQLDYSLTSVLFYYVILSGTHSLFTVPAARVAARFGFKHAIFFSIPFLVVAYAFLYTLETYSWPLWIIALMFGLSQALFWLGYHVDFAKFSDSQNRGKEVGMAELVSSFAFAIGPVSGGIMLSFFGFNTLLIVALIILLASVVPLFFSDDVHEPLRFSVGKLFKDQKARDFLAFFGVGLELWAWAVVWPAFIFFFILGKNYVSLGSVASLSLLFSSITTLVVGKFSDINRGLMLKVGAMFNSLVWIARGFVSTIFQVFLLESFYGVSQIMAYIPFDASTYDKANQSDIVEYIAFREIVIHGGGMLFFLAMMFIADVSAGFYFGVAGSWLMMLF